MSSIQHQQPSHPTINLPDTFNSSGTKLVYLYLRIEGQATIDELHHALGMKKVTLYSLLKTLTATDLVAREGGAEYVYHEQPSDGGTP
jgi:predicted transcriptional regulator